MGQLMGKLEETQGKLLGIFGQILRIFSGCRYNLSYNFRLYKDKNVNGEHTLCKYDTLVELVQMQVDAQIYDKLTLNSIHNSFEKTHLAPLPPKSKRPLSIKHTCFKYRKKNCVVFLCFYCGQPNNKNTSDYIQIQFYVDFRT